MKQSRAILIIASAIIWVAVIVTILLLFVASFSGCAVIEAVRQVNAIGGPPPHDFHRTDKPAR